MGIVLLIVSYLIVALTMFLMGPILFWFSIVKFGKFEANSFVKHLTFWSLWLLVNTLIGLIQRAFTEVEFGLASLLNGSFVLTLFVHILICMFVFKAKFVSALKASLAYSVLFIMTFIIVAFLAVQLSFHELILGAIK